MHCFIRVVVEKEGERVQDKDKCNLNSDWEVT